MLRLLSLSIQPIFVFDGPHKPAFKRNKRSGRGDGVATATAKSLIRLFGFLVHDAPGEAEAECALLQQQGIVDAVLSEDVDTIMFGCTKTLKNWSSEGTKGSKAPTHVSLYDTAELRKGRPGLDREGMVLVALMSGGDYLPEGIPGAGVKLACEAARGGFGKTLCRLKRSDEVAMADWRTSLIRELQGNESGCFRTRHKALTVPGSFPNLDILRYYTHPVVSPPETLDRLKQQTWNRPVDVRGLRDFARETLNWDFRGGAVKFIRVLAPCLLVQKLVSLGAWREQCHRTTGDMEEKEQGLVRSISSRRAHFSTDATSELRLSFIPTDIVGYNFESEPEEVIAYGRDGLALNSDDEFATLPEEHDENASTSANRRRVFDPAQPALLWVPEIIAKSGIPLMVEDWEEARRAKASRQPTRGRQQKVKPVGMASGALDRYVKVTKRSIAPSSGLDEGSIGNSADKKKGYGSSRRLAHAAERIPAIQGGAPSGRPGSMEPPSPVSTKTKTSRPSKQSEPKANKKKGPKGGKADARVNPWTIASSQNSPRATRAAEPPHETILISSSPHATSSALCPSSPLGRAEAPRRPSSDSCSRVVHPPGSPSPDARGVHWGKSMEVPSRLMVETETPTRKLSRTESLPISSSLEAPSLSQTSKAARAFARSQTIGGEAVGFEMDKEDLAMPWPAHDQGTTSRPRPGSTQTQQHSRTRQSTLKEGPGHLKTKKKYVPRISQPGYFKEVEHMLEEVYGSDGAVGGGGEESARRYSNVSIVDLTGDE